MGHGEACCDVCQSVLRMFSCKSFMVSGVTFKSLIHFEFISCVSVLVSFFLYIVGLFLDKHMNKVLSYQIIYPSLIWDSLPKTSVNFHWKVVGKNLQQLSSAFHKGTASMTLQEQDPVRHIFPGISVTLCWFWLFWACQLLLRMNNAILNKLLRGKKVCLCVEIK